MDLKNHWDESHKKHLEKMSPSTYSVDKEKLFPRNSLVCDLGGGDGTDSLHFLKHGHKVYIYDISNVGLEKAKKKAIENGLDNKLITNLLDLSFGSIPVEDNFFDVVYARLSIHYFLEGRTIEILKEIFRVLKTGGKAFLAVKSPEDKAEMEWLEKNNRKISEEVYSEDGMIKSRYTKKQYENFLKKAGISNFTVGDYVEFFGDQKVYLKSNNDKLQYIDIQINK
jgi:ubiquinone/menaquinone biosynthesis C-methylase UbiE